MVDLFSFNKSLKTIWIKKYFDKTNMGKWKIFFDLELGWSLFVARANFESRVKFESRVRFQIFFLFFLLVFFFDYTNDVRAVTRNINFLVGDIFDRLTSLV